MSNFFRRAIAFILGMVFTVVVTVGAVAGSLYWAFKNLSLSQLGAEQDVLGDLNGLTIEEWVALVSDVNSSGNITFEALEKYGFDADNLITSMGVNPELADKEDVDMIKKISITNLAGANALNEIKMGVLFAFLPKSAETNTYPLFSKSARSTLRNYSLAEMTAVDNYTGKAKIWTIIGDMKFASIYSQPFEETYNEVEKKYEYTSDNYSLDLVGNLDFSIVANPLVHGQAFDIGKELNEGSLKDIGSEKINEFIASFIPDAETSEVVKNSLSVLSVAVKDLFFFNEVENAYQFDYTILLENLTVGKLIGANYDEENGVWLDAKGEPIVADNLEGEIMLGLYGLNINDVIEGFMSGEILSTLMQGAYFGSALGNKKIQIAPAGYCSASCSIEYEADGLTEHRHNYYWVDGEGYFVGEMFNLISNKKISDALTGDLDLIGDISSIKIGEILGYQLCANDDGCVVHGNSASCDGLWYNGSTPVSKDDSMSKILYNIYNYSLDDIKNGDMSIDGIVKGILLGDLLLYTRINNPNGEGGDYCDVDCADNHSHKYYWIDSQNNHLEALDEKLANISLEELVSGEFDVSDVFGDMLVGELMGYTQVDGVDGYCDIDCSLEHEHEYYFVDSSNNQITGVNAILASLAISDLTSGDVDFIALLGDMQIGELLGYEKCSNGSDCQVHTGTQSHDGGWYQSGVKVSALNEKIANQTITTLSSGDFTDIISDMYAGELMGYEKSYKAGYCQVGCAEDHTHEFLWLDGVNEVSKLNNSLANIKLSKLIDGTITFSDFVGDMYVGDMLEQYVKCSIGSDCQVHSGTQSHDGGWYEKKSSNNFQKVGALDSVIANIKLSNLINGETNFKEVVGELYIGDVIGYDKCSNDQNCQVHTGSQSHDGCWYQSGVKVSALNQKIANQTINGLSEGDFTDIIGDMYVGELMRYEISNKTGYCQVGCAEDHTHKFLWLDGGKEVSSLNNSLANIELQKLIDGDITFSDFVGDMYVGDMLEKYVKCSNGSDCQVHSGTQSHDGCWYELNSASKYEKVSALDQTIADIKLSALINGETNFKDVIGELYIGEVIGYKRCSNENCQVHTGTQAHDGGWYEKNQQGNYVLVSKLNSTIADHTFGDILGGMDFATVVGDLYVGDVMNYHIAEENEVPDSVNLSDYCVKGCETEHHHHYYWVDENKNHMLEVESIVANFKLSELMSGRVDITSEIKTLRFNDIISVENDSPMILQSLKYVKIGEMTEKMNTLTLGECIDMNDAPSILKALSATSINNLGTEMKTLYIGDVMGYEYCSGNQDCTLHSNCNNQTGWYKNGSLITGINAKLAGKTLEQVETSGFDTSEFVLGDVMEVDENGMFGLIYKGEYNSDGTMKEGGSVYNSVEEIPVSDIAKRMGDGVKSASVAQLENSGIISLNNDAKTKLDKLFALKNGLGTDYDSARELWSALTLDKLLNEIINSIPG